MPKLLKSMLIIIFLVIQLLITPLVYADVGIPFTNATGQCSQQGIIITLDAPLSDLKDVSTLAIGNGRPFGVNVKIADNLAENNWEYFLVFLRHPDLLNGTANYENRIKGDNPSSKETINEKLYRVYHWDIAGLLANPGETYSIGLKHTEPGMLGSVIAERNPLLDICRGQDNQIKIINTRLADVGGCPITMSDNFKSPDPVTGTVNLRNIPDIRYAYKLYTGDLSSKLSSFGNPLSPKDVRDLPEAIPLITHTAIGISNEFLQSGFWDLIGTGGNNVTLPPKTRNNGTYTAAVFAISTSGGEIPVYACGVRVITVSNDPTTSPNTKGDNSSIPGSGGTEGYTALICSGDKCSKSRGDSCDSDKGIKTAIGCIHTDPAGFVKDFLTFITAISGGLAFLMMLLGAFQMITSAGNPETLQAGRERFSSAIIGLLIVVLAVLLLKIIGVDILAIPGFTG